MIYICSGMIKNAKRSHKQQTNLNDIDEINLPLHAFFLNINTNP